MPDGFLTLCQSVQVTVMTSSAHWIFQKPFLTWVITSMAPGASTVYTVEPVQLRGLEETWHSKSTILNRT